MPHPHTSEAHHTTLINTHPKLFSQPSSAYIRSSSLKPHQHTSEAHLSTLISTHPKPISQPSSAHIRSPSLKPHQHTSEAHLSSHTKQSPKLRISINQSISQPIRPTIFFHNYNPKQPLSPNPLTTNRKKLTPHTSNAAPMPHHLPAHHKETQPLQPPRWQTVRSSLHSSHKKRAPRPKHPGTLPKPNNIISSAASSVPSPADPHAPSPSTYSPSLHSAPVQSLE